MASPPSASAALKDRAAVRDGSPLESAAGSLRSPLYHQIYLVLRQQIMDGVYGLDGRLPGEQDLIGRYGVSRITARRALDELAGEGLVLRERGRGTRVCARPPAEPMRTPVAGALENLIAMGLETEVRLLDLRYVPASADVAAALGCPPGETVQRAVRVRAIEGGPFSYLTTYVPEQIGRQYDREDLSTLPLLQLLERCGVVADSAQQTITATLADAEVAPHLDCAVGTALLKVSRVVRDPDGRPVEYINALYRPDRYQYRMVLSRVQGDPANRWAPRDEAN